MALAGPSAYHLVVTVGLGHGTRGALVMLTCVSLAAAADMSSDPNWHPRGAAGPSYFSVHGERSLRHTVAQGEGASGLLRQQAKEEIQRINAMRAGIGRPSLEFTADNVEINQELLDQLRAIREQDEATAREVERARARDDEMEALQGQFETEVRRLNDLRARHGKSPVQWTFERGQIGPETISQVAEEIERESKEE